MMKKAKHGESNFVCIKLNQFDFKNLQKLEGFIHAFDLQIKLKVLFDGNSFLPSKLICSAYSYLLVAWKGIKNKSTFVQGKRSIDVSHFFRGVLNVHGSILPRYRGAAPIPYAILNGDTSTGITIMEVKPFRWVKWRSFNSDVDIFYPFREQKQAFFGPPTHLILST